jgi:hypothetical protein
LNPLTPLQLDQQLSEQLVQLAHLGLMQLAGEDYAPLSNLPPMTYVMLLPSLLSANVQTWLIHQSWHLSLLAV